MWKVSSVCAIRAEATLCGIENRVIVHRVIDRSALCTSKVHIPETKQPQNVDSFIANTVYNRYKPIPL